MLTNALSATAIKDFMLCKLKAVLRYDRSLKKQSNNYAKLGVAVHHAAEQFTTRMGKKSGFPEPADYDFAMQKFMSKATSMGLSDMHMFREGRQIVKGFLDNFDPSEEVIAAEYRFELKTPENVPIIGDIDKVIKVDSETIAIIDYKTSQSAMPQDELDEDIQLSMYDLAASMKWPEYPNRILALNFLRLGKTVTTFRTDSQREFFREFLLSVWNEINILDLNTVRGNINNLCSWCDFRSYCKDYEALLKSPSLLVTPAGELSDEDFIKQWRLIQSQRSLVEARLNELKFAAGQKILAEGKILGSGEEMYSYQQARTKYDVSKVAGILPQEDLLKVLKVDTGSLKSYAGDRPEIRSQIHRIAEVSFTSPIFDIRPVKEDKKTEFEEVKD